MTAPLDEQAMRERHKRGESWCLRCNQVRPCDAIQALDALADVEQEQRFDEAHAALVLDQLARSKRVVEAARNCPTHRYCSCGLTPALVAYDVEVGR